MNQSIRHGLPLLAAGQAQKEVTHNEALTAIDMKLQISVESRSVPEPPSAPVLGSTYILPAGATGVWSEAEGMIAMFDGFGWRLSSPVRGTVVWVADEQGCIVWDGKWSSGWPVSSLVVSGRRVFAEQAVQVSDPVGGTVIDTEARACLVEILMVMRDQGLLL